MNYKMLVVKLILIGVAVLFFMMMLDGFTSNDPNGWAIQGPLCGTVWILCCASALLWRERA